MKLANIVKRYRIDKPDKFRLADYDPADTCGLSVDKADAKLMLADGVRRLAQMQEHLVGVHHVERLRPDGGGEVADVADDELDVVDTRRRGTRKGGAAVTPPRDRARRWPAPPRRPPGRPRASRCEP